MLIPDLEENAVITHNFLVKSLITPNSSIPTRQKMLAHNDKDTQSRHNYKFCLRR